MTLADIVEQERSARAKRRRRSFVPASPPPWDGFLGTTLLRSTGAPGSYAEAATSAAARVVFVGTAKPACSFVGWVTPTAYFAGQVVLQISDAGSPPFALISTQDDGGYYNEVDNASGSPGGTSGGDTSGQVHVALVCDGTDWRLYENGTLKATTLLAAAPYGAVDSFSLFYGSTGDPLPADIAGPALWSRALTALEVAALAVGVTVDPRTLSGGGPVHWWPGDGDSGTTVTDRGSVGGCNLTLHGGVSIVGP